MSVESAFSASALMPRSVVLICVYSCHIFFQVRGTCPDDVRAVQLPEVTASLNSDDVFILETPSATYLWIGQVCSQCCTCSLFTLLHIFHVHTAARIPCSQCCTCSMFTVLHVSLCFL